MSITNNCKQLESIISELFENQNSDEINENISLMMDVFIRHAEVEKLKLSNVAFGANKLCIFFLKLENWQNHKNDIVIKNTNLLPCLHN